MTTRIKPRVDVNAYAPTVPTMNPRGTIGRLAVAYSKAIDRAVAAEAEVDRLLETDTEKKVDAYERGKWRRAMAAFDRAELALFEKMKEHELRAIIVEDRLYMDTQTEEHYIPDRPQHVSYHTFGDE